MIKLQNVVIYSDLNTSHVNVKLIFASIVVAAIKNLNTSHVNVKLSVINISINNSII